MNGHADLIRLVGSGVIIFAVACSGPPTAPGNVSPSPNPPQVVPQPSPAPGEPQPPASVMTTFTVTNGWTGEAVAGAVVSAEGTQAVTNSAGQVQFLKAGNCLAVEVTVSGFLERRTCSHSAITLWPAADEEEREATRTMAFGRDDRLWRSPTGVVIPLSLTEDLRRRSDVVQTWTSAANEIQRLILNKFSFGLTDTIPVGEGGLVIAGAHVPPVCVVLLSPLWPVETGGFCGQWAEHEDYILRLNVLPDRLTERSTALRALVWGGIAMRPHAMPGLMNRNRPDPELSTFERKTLHMIGLRKGINVVWPDLDVP
jgi:hypothetical protein